MRPSDGSNRYMSIERFYGALRNLSEVEQRDIRSVVMGAFKPTLREKYLTLNYQRAAVNLELLLTLKNTQQFQAIGFLARTIFELAVEVRLIELNSDAGEKIDALTRIEKLKYAKKIVEFKKGHRAANVPCQGLNAFIAANEQSIVAEQSAMWPGAKKVLHWTMQKELRKRAESLGDPFHELYEVYYALLSWYSHAGIVGVANPTTDLFAFFVGTAYTVAVESYTQILEVIVGEFNLHTS